MHVISVDEVNAWCMPGGKMAMYTGLIQKLNATDDEIAAVMGHEIAHALREHSREQISRQMGTQIGRRHRRARCSASATSAQSVAGAVADVTLNLPKSRLAETEADRIGVELAARAGYDPRAAISLWEKMQKLGGSQPPKFLSTHPSHEDRINDLQQYAAKVMPLYQQAQRKALISCERILCFRSAETWHRLSTTSSGTATSCTSRTTARRCSTSTATSSMRSPARRPTKA